MSKENYGLPLQDEGKPWMSKRWTEKLAETSHFEKMTGIKINDLNEKLREQKKVIANTVKEIVSDFADGKEFTIDEKVEDYLFYQFGFVFDKKLLYICIRTVVIETMNEEGITLEDVENVGDRIKESMTFYDDMKDMRNSTLKVDVPSRVKGMLMGDFLD